MIKFLKRYEKLFEPGRANRVIKILLTAHIQDSTVELTKSDWVGKIYLSFLKCYFIVILSIILLSWLFFTLSSKREFKYRDAHPYAVGKIEYFWWWSTQWYTVPFEYYLVFWLVIVCWFLYSLTPASVPTFFYLFQRSRSMFVGSLRLIFLKRQHWRKRTCK